MSKPISRPQGTTRSSMAQDSWSSGNLTTALSQQPEKAPQSAPAQPQMTASAGEGSKSGSKD
jgi:hypothetical protein